MATYPINLPKPQVGGFSIKPVSPIISTDFEAGNKRTRRRTKVKRDTVSVVFKFKDIEMSLFLSWYDDEEGADAGNGWFDIHIPIGNGGLTMVEAKLMITDKTLINNRLMWSVTGTMEIRYA